MFDRVPFAAPAEQNAPSVPAPETDLATVNAAGEADLSAWLAVARQGDGQSLGRLLQHYRNYLLLVASLQVEPRWRPRFSPSDVVQEAMLRAHCHFAQFRGGSEREFLAWLRQILVTSLARHIERHQRAAKRDLRREVSLDELGASLARSSPRAVALAVAGPTPSAVVERREEALALADRLAQLPAKYREILVLRHVQGLSFEQAAAALERSIGATRMLWLRAIQQLRRAYREGEEQDA